MILLFLLTWVLFYATKASVQTMARLRPAVAVAPAETSAPA